MYSSGIQDDKIIKKRSHPPESGDFPLEIWV